MKEGNKRKTGKEQYYTKSHISDLCCSIVKNTFPSNQNILEPCGGTGAFLDSFETILNTTNYLSYDLEPKDHRVMLMDFFKIKSIKKPFIIITNPPFGRMNKLSVNFFNHAANLGAEYICFLIPISWRKWSTQNRLDRNYHLIKDIDLPTDEILFHGDDVDQTKKNQLKCIFQIWKREGFKRETIEYKWEGLTSTKPVTADIAIIQQGWSCGKVLREFDRDRNLGGYNYYYAEEDTIRKLEFLYNQNAYEEFKNNSAYVDSISLSEISYELNKLK